MTTVESFKIAGIDAHQNMLAVMITDVAVKGESHFERRTFGTSDTDLRALSEYLSQHGVREVVMESTADYWKPVWHLLEFQFPLYLAEEQDDASAEQLLRRHIAGDLILRFMLDPDPPTWRTVARTKYQFIADRGRVQSQLESFLEEARIKLSVSSRRLLKAIANSETNPAALAQLEDGTVRATQAELTEAQRAAATLSPQHRKILRSYLEQLELIERQMETLDQDIAGALQQHRDAVTRLADETTPG